MSHGRISFYEFIVHTYTHTHAERERKGTMARLNVGASEADDARNQTSIFLATNIKKTKVSNEKLMDNKIY